MCVMVLKFDVQEENLISKFVLLSDVRPVTDFCWPQNLTNNLCSVFMCLCECVSFCVSGNSSVIAAWMKKSSVLIGGSFPLQT